MDLALFVFILISLSLISLSIYFFKMVAEMQPLNSLRNYVLKVNYDRKVKAGKIKITEEVVEYDDLPADVQVQIRPTKSELKSLDRLAAGLGGALAAFAGKQRLCKGWTVVHNGAWLYLSNLTLGKETVEWSVQMRPKAGGHISVRLYPLHDDLCEMLEGKVGQRYAPMTVWYSNHSWDWAVGKITKDLHVYSMQYVSDKKVAERQSRKAAKRRKLEGNKEVIITGIDSI